MSDLKNTVEAVSKKADPSIAQSTPNVSIASEPTTYYKEPVWKKFYAFILGPALLAAVAMVIFVTFSMLTKQDASPAQLVEQLSKGSKHGKWQSAFALTKFLQPTLVSEGGTLSLEDTLSYERKLKAVRELVPQLLQVWHEEEDPQVRRFLALAFGYLGEARTLEPLLQASVQEDEELAHYSLSALTHFAEKEPKLIFEQGREVLQQIAQGSNPSLAAAALYLISVVGEGDPIRLSWAKSQLAGALEKDYASVKWNAAFGLARLGESEGEEIIHNILARSTLYADLEGDYARQQDLFLNAVRSAGMLRTQRLDKMLAQIADTDKNLKARNIAKKILKEN